MRWWILGAQVNSNVRRPQKTKAPRYRSTQDITHTSISLRLYVAPEFPCNSFEVNPCIRPVKQKVHQPDINYWYGVVRGLLCVCSNVKHHERITKNAWELPICTMVHIGKKTAEQKMVQVALIKASPCGSFRRRNDIFADKTDDAKQQAERTDLPTTHGASSSVADFPVTSSYHKSWCSLAQFSSTSPFSIESSEPSMPMVPT